MSNSALAERFDGRGAILQENGVGFRVWAPHAEEVYVLGDFNNWDGNGTACSAEDNGYWACFIEGAKAGDEYKYRIINGDQILDRNDPYAREVTNSVGNSIVFDTTSDWGNDEFHVAPFNELVIYEMHVGTFNRSNEDQPGTFLDAIKKLGYLRNLGINAVEVMPIAEFAGDFSWGYNPAHMFAIEQAYGGPEAFRKFVRAAHEKGIAVIMDVVYNHFGPSDLDIWQFDGWSGENNKGGIYFYNDWRSATPWGDTRPDYGRGEVRQFIHDNAMMWLNEYHVDGLRYDMTAYIRKVNGIDESDIPEGWSLMQWINADIASRFPGKLLIAEDLQGNEYLTRSSEDDGAGFSSQWDANFVHPVRDVVQQIDDAHRSMEKIRGALEFRYNVDAFERVIYSESHDEIANGKARVPQEIDPENPDSGFAQKRSVLAAALALTGPGIPMLMQGQEFLEDEYFDDGDPLDWEREKKFSGIRRLYRDLIQLRRNFNDVTRGLCGQHVQVHHVNDVDKLIAFRRWKEGGAGDDVVVVMNFCNQPRENYAIGFPAEGDWKLRFNSDWKGYSESFDDHPAESVTAVADAYDGLEAKATITLGAYGILIYSQDRE